MNFLSLLRKTLKDDEVIGVLESLEMEVIYDFDRLHEGRPDKYWAAAPTAGIQLQFDEAQTLDTIFFYIMPDDGFAACMQEDSDVPFFTTAAEVQAFGETQRLQISRGRADFLGVIRDWIRLGCETHSVHYEFHADALARVTVSRNKD